MHTHDEKIEIFQSDGTTHSHKDQDNKMLDINDNWSATFSKQHSAYSIWRYRLSYDFFVFEYRNVYLEMIKLIFEVWASKTTVELV